MGMPLAWGRRPRQTSLGLAPVTERQHSAPALDVAVHIQDLHVYPDIPDCCLSRNVLTITLGVAVGEVAVELIRAYEKPIKVGLCVVYIVVLSGAVALWLLR